MTTTIATLKTVFSADTAQLDKALVNADKGIGGFVKNIGGSMTRIGSSMSLLAAPLVGALAGATFAAVGFDEAMTNAASVLGKNRDEMAGLNAQVLALGSASMAGPQAAAEAYYDIVSGVQDASTHMAILEAAIATSEAGAASLTGTTSALVSIMNSYGYSADKASYASDVLTRTVGMGVGSMEEFAAAFPQVTGLANSMGIEFGDLGAMMAFITTKGFSASEAATQLKASMTAMLNPNESMIAALNELGVASGQALVEQYGLVGAMQQLSTTGTVGEKGIAKVLGSVEALNAFLTLTGMGAEEFMTTFGMSIEGATEAARQIQLESPAAQFKLLKSQVMGLAIEIGTEFLPVLMDITKEVKPIVKSIAGWVRENKPLVKQIGLAAIAFAGFGAALTVGGAIISGIGTAIAILGGALAFLLSPIGLLVAGIVAIGVAYKTNFLGFADTVNDLAGYFNTAWASASAFFDGLIGAFNEGGLSGAGNFINSQIVQPIISTLQNVTWDDVKGLGVKILQTALPIAIDIGTTVYDAVGKPVVDAVNNIDWAEIGSLPQQILDGATGTVLDAAAWVSDNILTPVKNGLMSVTATDFIGAASIVKNQILGALATAWTEGTNLIDWAVNNVINPVASGIEDAVTNVDWIGTGQAVIDAVKGGIAAANIDETAQGWVNTFSTGLQSVDWAPVQEAVTGNVEKTVSGSDSHARVAGEFMGTQLGIGFANAVRYIVSPQFADVLAGLINIIGTAFMGAVAVVAAGGLGVINLGIGIVSSFFKAVDEEWGLSGGIHDHVLIPIQDAFTSSDARQKALDDAYAFAVAIGDEIKRGFDGLIGWVNDNVLNPLISAYNNTIGRLPGVNSISPVGGGGGGVPWWEVAQNILAAQNLPSIPGFASGGWTGSGTGIAGVVHGSEYVVPSQGMSVIPSPRGLMLQGGGRGGITINEAHFHGVQDARELQRQLEAVTANSATRLNTRRPRPLPVQGGTL